MDELSIFFAVLLVLPFALAFGAASAVTVVEEGRLWLYRWRLKKWLSKQSKSMGGPYR